MFQSSLLVAFAFAFSMSLRRRSEADSMLSFFS